MLSRGDFLNRNSKKSFSTANLFFICTVGILILKYFHNCYQITISTKPLFSNIMLVFTSVVSVIWIAFKFPLFVKTEEDMSDLSFYDNIYSKNINFWSRLYLVFFEFIKPSPIVSLFSPIILNLGVKNRECKFILIIKKPRFVHRFLDVVLAVVFGLGAFFVSNEITKFGAIFGVLMYILTMLVVYKKVFLNYIYSVTISKVNGYNLNIIYAFNIFDGIFSNLYGLAYDINKSILLSTQVFCGGENLKKYVIAHEEGHLATKSRKQTLLITLIFGFTSFLGIAGPCIASEFFSSTEKMQWLIVAFYIIFIFAFNKLVSRKNRNNEFAADAFAIKKIGKDLVLKGLTIIKADSLYRNSAVKLSGLEIDRRIEFVERYED